MIRAKRKFSINESRCVANVDYNLEEGTLIIDFMARGSYKYENFPLDEYVDFASAGSQGKYFNLYIRPKYNGVRIG
jgi:hypothetical protein